MKLVAEHGTATVSPRAKSSLESLRTAHSALVKVECDEVPDYFERDICAEFECGGQLHVIARGDCVSKVIRQVMASCSAVVLNRELVFSFRLTYWALDNDLNEEKVTVSCTDAEVVSTKSRGFVLCQALAIKAKRLFLKRMAKAGVTLYGRDGSLEKGGAN